MSSKFGTRCSHGTGLFLKFQIFMFQCYNFLNLFFAVAFIVFRSLKFVPGFDCSEKVWQVYMWRFVNLMKSKMAVAQISMS